MKNALSVIPVAVALVMTAQFITPAITMMARIMETL